MKIHVLILISLLFYNCSNRIDDIEIPPRNMKLIPDIGGEMPENQQTFEQEENKKEDILPHIPIGSDYRVIYIEENNLDNDIEDEQIIVTQYIPQNEGETANLEIWIADYRSTRNDYVLSWKSATRAVSVESMSLSFKNITGSAYDEIALLGFNENNYQTLDLFYSNGNVYQYTNILSLEAKGSIEMDFPSSVSGINGNGLSEYRKISVIVSEEDPQSENPLDILQSVWTLNQNTHHFYLTEKTRIAEDDLQLEEIRKILQGDESDFLNHLQGFWYKEGINMVSEELPLLFISPQEESVYFLIDNEMEDYELQYYHKGIYSKMYMKSVNSNIRNTSRNITITLDDLDKISLVIEDNNDKSAVQSIWTGQYKRMGGNLLADIIPQVYHPINIFDSDIKGKYRSIDGEELNIQSPPHFTLISEEEEKNGSYALIQWEEDILLELNYFSRRGALLSQEFYKLEQFTESTEDSIVRSIILTPGSFTIRGFAPSGEKNRGFEQIEIKGKEES